MKEKKAFNYRTRLSSDLPDLYLNPGSVLHCEGCQLRLGVLHTLRHALFKKPGTHYFVPCKRCGHVNERIKGAYKQEVDQRWKDLEQQVKDEEHAPRE